MIRSARVSDDQSLVDIFIQNGRIRAMASRLDYITETTVIDADGRVVTPGLIESHIHPDKAFLEERLPNQSGTLSEAIHNTSKLKAEYTFEDVFDRARKVLHWAIRHGTTVVRAHPDVDPIAKLMGVEALLKLRESFTGYLDMQIASFPQEGIMRAPGTLELMEESIKLGCDVIGGCPYNEESEEESLQHIRTVFRLGERYDLPVDMHVDLADNRDDPRYLLTDMICDLVISHGMQGKVTLGHVTSLGSMDLKQAGPLFDKIARAGVTIVPLPATDLFLNGRKDKRYFRRGVAPVKALLEHSVNVAYSSNNIRNAFTPFGNANLLEIGYLLAEAEHMGSAQDQRLLLKMITDNAAMALGISHDYGLQVGRPGDLVIFDSRQLRDVIADQPTSLYVIKGGRIIVRNRVETEYPHGLP